MAEPIRGLLDIIGGYDVVLCDVWGVLHNGVDVFPAAAEALIAARAQGKTVVLITNSPRPHPGVISQLELIGVPDGVYDRIVTSGDVTRALIAAGPKNVFLLGPERDGALLDGLGVTEVPAEEAEIVVCTGFFDDERETPEDYTAMLGAFIARNVPMICANPDLVVERGHQMIPCAGAMAAHYRVLGGETRIAGKPHAPIYAAALQAAEEARGGAVDLARVIAIGDGMPTDVRGAVDQGLALLYIAGGIHAADYTSGTEIDAGRLDSFLAGHGVSPAYWMPRLG